MRARFELQTTEDNASVEVDVYEKDAVHLDVSTQVGRVTKDELREIINFLDFIHEGLVEGRITEPGK